MQLTSLSGLGSGSIYNRFGCIYVMSPHESGLRPGTTNIYAEHHKGEEEGYCFDVHLKY